MNIYVVTEGITEKKIYSKWIGYANPKLSYIDTLNSLKTNNYYIVAGGGNPYYFEVISNGIKDVNKIHEFDRLVICVDADHLTKDEKQREITDLVNGCRAEIRIVIQDFCFEAWGLGNRKLIRPNPAGAALQAYKRHYDVSKNDPALLPEKADENLSRMKFAEKYLKSALNDKFRQLTYIKSNPKPLLHSTYFNQLSGRLQDTGHISSFGDFLDAFK